MIVSDFKLKHIIKIYLYTLFYSLLFLNITYTLNSNTIEPILVKYSLFPISNQAYTFISNYIYLYLFIPFINILIKSMNKKQCFALLLLTTIGWCIIPTFISKGITFSNLGLYIYLYMLGAFIRLDIFKFLSDKKLLMYLSILTVIFMSITISSILFPHNVSLIKAVKFQSINSPCIIIYSLFIFNYFKSLNIKYNKWINYAASSVLSIYLIHDNIFVRMYLWRKIVPFLDINSPYYLLINIGICLTIFIVCMFFDKVFNFFFGKSIEKFSALIGEKVTNIYNKVYFRIFERNNII